MSRPGSEILDRIERELFVPYPIERVWAITDSREIAGWFGDRADIELRPGGEAVFWFGSHPVRAVIVAVEAPHYFSYRWTALGAVEGTPVLEGPHTLVEFTLEPVSEGTRLRLVESGFASLGLALEAHQENAEGWDQELDQLAGYLRGAA